jgi:peptidoglycan-N-acetylglucosamine deacetylase
MNRFQGNGNRLREVVLSFDDGPHVVNTPLLLDILANQGVKAVFFLMGIHLVGPSGNEILERIRSEGHYIGNHTRTHPDLTRLTEAEIRDEIAETANLIGDADQGIKLFRPPFGSHNPLVDEVAHDLGYDVVFWNVDTRDWDFKLQHGGWVQYGLSQIESREHSLVLAHDHRLTTVVRMEEFITAIKAIPDVELRVNKKSLLKLAASVPYPPWDAVNHEQACLQR